MQSLFICPDEGYAGNPRPQKGKSMLDFPSDYVVIDIETTGFDSRIDEIIEMAAIRISGSKVVDQFQTLVRPENPIPEYITKLTGISDLMVVNAPSLETALPQFLVFIGESVVVAHNANFDINFIYDFTRALDLPPISNDFIDTLRLSRRVFPQWSDHKLPTLVHELGIPFAGEHRALVDCLQTSRCYEAIQKHVRENNVKLSFSYNAMSKQISAQATSFDPGNPFYKRIFVFTGALDRMPRKEAMQYVVDCGGICADGVTRETDFLVLGNNDYCSTIKDGKSAKQKKAEKMKSAGSGIEIISENVFYDMLAEAAPNPSDDNSVVPVSRTLTDGRVFSIIRPALISVLEKNNAPIEWLRLSRGQQYTSVIYSSALVCHLHFRGGNSFIVLSSSGADQAAHIPISSKEDLIAAADRIATRLDDLVDNLPAQFDCCSRYEQCSDALRCIHPSPALAVGCRYRRNLKAGKVFYGKNAVNRQGATE